MGAPHVSRSAAVVLALTMSACIACVAVSTEALSDRAQEDDLAAFGRANPQCQLWTDWRGMCSRTGSQGGTVCTEDPSRPVAPSEPFCVADTPRGDGAADLSAMSEAQRSSILRFCESTHRLPTRPDGRAPEFCSSFRADRPFSGRSIAARIHPWCGAWNDVATGRPVCTVDGRGSAPRCAELASANRLHERGLYCSVRTIPQWCEGVRGFGTRSAGADPARPTVGLDPTRPAVAIGDRDEIHAVSGIYCRRRG